MAERSKTGEFVGGMAAIAIVGGILLPIIGVWLGLGWRVFRVAAGW